MKIFFGLLVFAAILAVVFKRAKNAKQKLADRSMAREMLLMAQIARAQHAGPETQAGAPVARAPLAHGSLPFPPAPPAKAPLCAPRPPADASGDAREPLAHNPLAPWRKEDIERERLRRETQAQRDNQQAQE